MADTMLRKPSLSLSRIAFKGIPLLFALLILAVLSQTEPRLAVFWLFGLAFGFVLQRARFCFASAFRDLFLLQDGRVMKAILLGLSISTVGFSLVMYNLLPNIAPGRLPFNAPQGAIGLHIVLGGVLFGLGMVLAGGCTSGNLYRIGEGYVASMVAVVGMVVGLALLHHSWNWWWETYIRYQPVVWFPAYLGWGGGILLTLLLVVAAFFLVLWWESRGGLRPVRRQAQEATGASLGAKLSSLWNTVVVKSWPAVIGGAVLALFNVGLYTFERPWGVVGEIARWSEGALSLIRWPAPPHTGGAGPCSVPTGPAPLLTWGLFINTGIIAGSFLASYLAGEFRWRVPRQARRYVQSLAGGVLMGYGGGLAGGCTIGAFFSAVPSLGLYGWSFAVSLALGAFVGVQVIKRIG